MKFVFLDIFGKEKRRLSKCKLFHFRLFLSWSIIIIFLKPIFMRSSHVHSNIQILSSIQCINYLLYSSNETIPRSPRFQIDFPFSKRPSTSSITSKAKQRLGNPLFQIKSDLLSKSRLTSLIRDHRGTEWRPFFDHEISAPTSP